MSPVRLLYSIDDGENWLPVLRRNGAGIRKPTIIYAGQDWLLLVIDLSGPEYAGR